MIFRSQTTNVHHALGEKVIHCNTQAEAEHLFDIALDAGLVECTPDVMTRTTMTRQEFPAGTYN